MSKDPVRIADRIRAQRRMLRRILRVSLPLTLIGFVIVFAVGSRVSEQSMSVVILPTVLAFFTSWLSIWGLWVLGIRDFRNMLRPGSAEAYEQNR